MAVDLAQIRTALAAALTAHLGATGQQISPYVLKDPSFPTLWVRPKPDTPITYHEAMGASGGGVQMWEFLVEAYCGSGVDIAAQVALDTYVSDGASSVLDALEADLTLGGKVKTLIVRSCQNYVEFQMADGRVAIGASWLVEVYP